MSKCCDSVTTSFRRRRVVRDFLVQSVLDRVFWRKPMHEFKMIFILILLYFPHKDCQNSKNRHFRSILLNPIKNNISIYDSIQ